MREELRRIETWAKDFFENVQGSHDWDHTCRVFRLCMRIGKVEGADLDVLTVAAYLHDIGRRWQDESKGRVCHAKKGAEIARTLLADFPLAAVKKKNILHCIRTHRFRDGSVPRTTEARVLFDADKLDAMGAIGIARVFQFAGEVGARLHNPAIDPQVSESYTDNDTGFREYKLKLSKLKDRMLTDEGRRMADTRHQFMALFFQRFLEEHEALT